MKGVIDSDVLIDFLQGVPAAAMEIDRYDDPCYAVISWMEVLRESTGPGVPKSLAPPLCFRPSAGPG